VKGLGEPFLGRFLHLDVMSNFSIGITYNCVFIVKKYLLMQSYPPRALDRRLQEYWVRDVGEGPRILMGFMVDFGPMSSV